MWKLKIIFATLVLFPAPALAQIIEPTEVQYVRYETRLEELFSFPAFVENNGKYLRTSDAERRTDGQVYCSLLNDYSVKKFLEVRLASRQALYGDSPQKLKDESAYVVGVTVAAIDTLCTERRAELMDFFEDYNKDPRVFR